MTLVEIQAQNQLGEGSIAVGEESEYQWQRETGATDEQIVRYVFFACTTISWPTERSFRPLKRSSGGLTRQTSDKMELMSEYSMTGFGHAVIDHPCSPCLRHEFGCPYSFLRRWRELCVSKE